MQVWSELTAGFLVIERLLNLVCLRTNMKTKAKEHNVKLPSGDVVTVKNLLEISKIIANTGKSFEEKNILDNKSPVNKSNLFRVLSYLKYLGLIYDSREIQKVDGKDRKTQKWHQRDTSKTSEFFYNLKASRDEIAKEKFIEIIRAHDIFLGVKEELIPKISEPTELDLENYFKNKVPGKNPKYYQRGIRLVLSLLSYCELIVKEGNIFRLISSEEGPAITPSEDESKEDKKSSLNVGKNRFVVQIKGEKDTNFQFAINELTDIDDVNAILEIIRKKLT